MEQTGIVLSRKSSDIFIIATSSECVYYNASKSASPINLGDSVKFFLTPARPSEVREALDLVKIDRPFGSTVIDKDGTLLVKCEISNIYDNRGNDRAFKTNLFNRVLESETTKNIRKNVLIGRNIYVTAKRSDSRIDLAVVEIDEDVSFKNLIGFVYGLDSTRRALRVHVPNYPDDFVIEENESITYQDFKGRWVEFASRNGVVDMSYRLKSAESRRAFDIRKKKNGYEMLIPCQRSSKEQKVTTITLHTLADKYNTLGRYNMSSDFHGQLLWCECSTELSGRIRFIVAETQEQLGERSFRSRKVFQTVGSTHPMRKSPPIVESITDRFENRNFVSLLANDTIDDDDYDDDDDDHLVPHLPPAMRTQQRPLLPSMVRRPCPMPTTRVPQRDSSSDEEKRVVDHLEGSSARGQVRRSSDEPYVRPPRVINRAVTPPEPPSSPPKSREALLLENQELKEIIKMYKMQIEASEEKVRRGEEERRRMRDEIEETRSSQIMFREEMKNGREKMDKIRNVASIAFCSGRFAELEAVIFS